jgi:RimJ/RimL family protein N-acetyltransferase
VSGPVFATARLEAVPAAEADLDALLEVFRSNPDTLAITEGSAGEPGRFDRGMLERDLWMAELEAGRTAAALIARDGGAVVGSIDWVERHPRRGVPWVGALLILAGRQRQGLGREALDGLAEHGRQQGWRALGAGALADDPRAVAFLEACGFAPQERVVHRFAAPP